MLHVFDVDGTLLPRTTDSIEIADAPGRARMVAELCERLGTGMTDVVAYGDSQSEVPLFGLAGASVAVNADDHVSGLASVRYQGEDLYEAYQLGLRALAA